MSQPIFFAHPFHGTLQAGRTNQIPVVEATFVFADVVGSTALAQRLGERGAYSVIRRFCGLVRDLSGAAGGEALELRGDGALLAFPTAPCAALETACELQRACAREGEIALRIGIHGGRALRLERGYFGRALTLAGRLSDAAEGGEILVSDSLLQASGPTTAFARGARWGSARRLRVKGFDEIIEAHLLEWHPFATTPWRRFAPLPGAGIGAESIS
jgi:class 3 adenylate cyclase